MGALRIMTYNIHHGADVRDRPNLDAMANLLAGIGPDVVCLQEADREYQERSGFADQPALLAAPLGATAVFLPNISKGERGGYGNAVLSRFPVDYAEYLSLPTAQGEEPRGAVHCRLSTPDGQVHVVCTHLNHLPQDGRGRAAQLTVLRDYMTKVLADDPAPLLLAGDFNAGPSRPEMRLLDGLLRDAWVTAKGRGRAAWTVGRAPGGTFPSTWPVRRIDYVWTTPDCTPVAAGVPADTASDHRPLVVDVSWEG